MSQEDKGVFFGDLDRSDQRNFGVIVLGNAVLAAWFGVRGLMRWYDGVNDTTSNPWLSAGAVLFAVVFGTLGWRLLRGKTGSDHLPQSVVLIGSLLSLAIAAWFVIESVGGSGDLGSNAKSILGALLIGGVGLGYWRHRRRASERDEA